MPCVFQLVLVCGLTAELNIVSDLDLQLSAQQLYLLTTLADQMMALPSNAMQHSSGRNRRAGPAVASEDSGVASEVSTATHLDPLQRMVGSEGVHIPANVLLTAGRISLALYTHLWLQLDTWVNPAYASSTKHTSPPPHSHRQQSARASFSVDNFVSLTKGMPDMSQDAVTQEDCTTFSFTQPHIDQDVGVKLAGGSVCVQPFVYIYIAQPHTVLSTWPNADRLELSCYDIVVKGVRHNYMFPGILLTLKKK